MNLLIPAAAFGAYYLYSMKDTGERLRKCEINSFKLGKIQLGLQQTTIPVELQVFNPNNTDVPAEYFRGIVSRAGKRIADFTFDSQGKSVMLKRGTTTPLIFNVRITTLGIVTNLVGLFKSMVAAKPFETTFTVNGTLRINGFDIPVNFSWDAKAGKAVQQIAGIGSADSDFYNRELRKGLNLFFNWSRQKLNYDSKDEAEELKKLLIQDKDWLLEKVEWLCNGSYGSEYQFVVKNWYKNLSHTDKRRENGLRSMAINTFLLLCSSEFRNLNSAKVVSIVKKVMPKQEMEIFNKRIANIIEGIALEEHWIYN